MLRKTLADAPCVSFSFFLSFLLRFLDALCIDLCNLCVVFSCSPIEQSIGVRNAARCKQKQQTNDSLGGREEGSWGGGGPTLALTLTTPRNLALVNAACRPIGCAVACETKNST